MKVKVLMVAFILKIVVFGLWFAMSSGLVDFGIVHAEQPLIRETVVTDGVKVVDLEGGDIAVEGEGAIEADTDSLITDTERSMLEAMKRRESELKAREDNLKKYEQRLAVVNSELDLRMKELKATKDVVDKALLKLKIAEKSRSKRVVKIYESMAPEEAAARIENLDEKTAVMILSTMKEKKAGAVLGLVSVEKAVRYSQLMNKSLVVKKKKR